MSEPELTPHFIKNIAELEEIMRLMERYKVNEVKIGDCSLSKNLHEPFEFKQEKKESDSGDPLDDPDMYWSAR